MLVSSPLLWHLINALEVAFHTQSNSMEMKGNRANTQTRRKVSTNSDRETGNCKELQSLQAYGSMTSATHINNKVGTVAAKETSHTHTEC